MLPANSIPQSDTLVTPIVTELAALAQQIEGIGDIYIDTPDRAPADNSVLFPMRDFRILDEANGLYHVELVFEILHVFRRTNLSVAVKKAYAALPAWLHVLTAWTNQTLNGTAMDMVLEREPCSIKGTNWGDTPYLAISIQVAVTVELPVDMTV
jgi:hypothetical protein